MEATAKKSGVSAAIDLGSNGFRLLIASLAEGVIIPRLRRLINVRLAEGLESSGFLGDGAVRRGLAALKEFKRDIVSFRPQFLRCYGTEALRRAGNREEFVREAEGIIGGPVEIITGQREAELTALGVVGSPGLELRFPMLILDVGGGSTEAIRMGRAGQPPELKSFPLGAVSRSVVAEGVSRDLPGGFSRELGLFLGGHSSEGRVIVGSGGTATAIAVLDLGLRCYEGRLVHGHFISQTGLAGLCENLGRMSPEELGKLPGLDEGRGSIIVAGIEIFAEALATIGADGMIVSDTGFLEGMILHP